VPEIVQWIIIAAALIAAGIYLFRSLSRQVTRPEEGHQCGHQSCTGCSLSDDGACPGGSHARPPYRCP
jgi:hypothetical protein